MQILTKGDGSRDFDLLDGEDWYGITLDGETSDNGYSVDTVQREKILMFAKNKGIKTWISFEPVLDADIVLSRLWYFGREKYVDKVKIGKLNYFPSVIDWALFGEKAEFICNALGMDYYIKESLRAEMRKGNA